MKELLFSHIPHLVPDTFQGQVYVVFPYNRLDGISHATVKKMEALPQELYLIDRLVVKSPKLTFHHKSWGRTRIKREEREHRKEGGSCQLGNVAEQCARIAA